MVHLSLDPDGVVCPLLTSSAEFTPRTITTPWLSAVAFSYGKEGLADERQPENSHQARESSTHLSRRRTSIGVRNHIVDFRKGCTEPNDTIVRCTWFGRFNRLEEEEKERKVEKKVCHIRADPVMQIVQKSLPVLAVEVLR